MYQNLNFAKLYNILLIRLIVAKNIYIWPLESNQITHLLQTSASEKKLSSKKDQNTYKYTSILEIFLRNIKLHRFSKCITKCCNTKIQKIHN